ncbi:DUF6493 family protein [Lentzea sp. NBRC 102530]|uniref:DUF6493 family protein n=1 Tax=Lentzea sp. NBRC 102530 TaxID=3032201 RepID=UPI0024A0B08B|nr:DUF6493 family protein [Lentzea sp. NBRC 102530]GLY51129.1 hypothetical protein Lesp01_47850 [Lentzea sp. NBRC 102530]
MSFDRIRVLIEAHEFVPLGEALNALTPAERKALVPDLLAFEKAERASDIPWKHREHLAIAGAGLLQSAATLAPWLLRHAIWSHHDSPEDATTTLLSVLRHRELPWLPDLTTRLAAKMPAREPSRPDLMRLVVEFCGDTPPDSDGFLLHFLACSGHRYWRPGFEVLFPRLLEAPGAGAYFGDARPVQAFLVATADRGLLVDRCLANLQAGGPKNEVTGLLELHRALGVTVEEATAHARDYVAMLPDSRSTVATAAQDQLKRVDDAGKLDFGLLTEASRWVFGRTEKKLVRAQLAWLANHAKAHPDEVALTAADLFTHASDDLRGQAVKLVAGIQVGDETRAELLTLAEQLPADLAQRFGVQAVAEEAVALAEFTPTPWPEPIATLDELAREARALFSRNAGDPDAVTTERIIEAVVRFSWQDRDAVAQAFAPIYEKYPYTCRSHVYETNPARSRGDCWAVLVSIIGAPAQPLTPISEAEASATRFAPAEPGTALTLLLSARMHEIAKGLVKSPRPALVSTPTTTSGLLDVATLLERLAKAEAENWEPWPDDLHQACHRLPRDARPEDFASLTSESGSLLRAWLGDRTDPIAEVVERTRETEHLYVTEQTLEWKLLVTLTPGLSDPERYWRVHSNDGAMLTSWPAALPTQRETVAAYLVPLLANGREEGDFGRVLPALAETDGPAGVATHLALAYGLGAAETAGRAHAVDALLILAARDHLDGALLGDHLGRLLERGELAMNRLAPGLRDAARSGAAQQIWDALAVALPKSFSHNRVADLIELAVELAQRVEASGDIAGLAEVAARKGSGKAVVQAKRLLATLG